MPEGNERALRARVQLLASKLGARLFRQNVGMGYSGVVSERRGSTVVLEDARVLHCGLCTGSSDLIGWTPVVVTPDMVGKTLAVFTAVELKAGRTATTEAQKTFIDAVNRAGGIAGIVREADQVRGLLAR